MISDAASRSQTPGMFQDEDSLLSTPANYSSGGGVDDKTALLRMLEEASCSSSSEDSEDEEISEWQYTHTFTHLHIHTCTHAQMLRNH